MLTPFITNTHKTYICSIKVYSRVYHIKHYSSIIVCNKVPYCNPGRQCASITVRIKSITDFENMHEHMPCNKVTNSI